MDQQPLFEAIKAGRADEVNRLVRENPACLKTRDVNGASPLYMNTNRTNSAIRIVMGTIQKTFRSQTARQTVGRTDGLLSLSRLDSDM